MKFRELTKKQKMKYLWDYYKLPIFGALVGIYILLFLLFRFLNRTEPVVYVALVNVSGSIAEDGSLTSGYLDTREALPEKAEVVLYKNLYLTADEGSEFFVYSEASEMKLIGSIRAKKLDVVIADQEAFEAFREQGYLAETARISESALLKSYGYTDPIYAGIIRNTPRPEEAGKYLSYLKK